MQIITRNHQVLMRGYAWWRVTLVLLLTLVLAGWGFDKGIGHGIREAIETPISR